MSRDGYIRIRDELVLKEEVQEMEDEENFLQQVAVQGPCSWIFLGIPSGAHLSLALVPSNGLGALSRVRGEFGAGNVYRLLVDIFQSNGQKF
jgi:hypothetical protein